jgi:hypothetical protein
MGTRGAIGFRINNEDKIQYNHFDSYPSYLGLEILTYLQQSNFSDIKKVAERIILVNEEDTPSIEQIKECKPWTTLNIEEQNNADWYCLLQDTQGSLQSFSEGLKYMNNSKYFLLNSLSCEYAYIINVDDQVLEYYCGFNKKSRNRKGRYASLQPKYATEYYGVVLLKKYSLDTLFNATDKDIKNFIKEMEKKEKEFKKIQEKEINEEKLVAFT